MKAGVRAVGIAESYTGKQSTLAGVVTRASRVVDGFAYGACTVGGTDATQSVIELVRALDREDVRYALVAGIAPAWYNVLDLPAIHDAIDRPVVSVSFEESTGLLTAMEREFSGDDLDHRREIYERLPARERLVVNEEPVFVRSVGVGRADARDVVRAFTPEGGRPEPLRVARLAARAADQWRTDS